MRLAVVISLCAFAWYSHFPAQRAFASPLATAGEACPAQAPLRTGLYTDAEIRALARFDIDKEAGPDRFILNIPCLDVVPAGDAYPRAKVFKALAIGAILMIIGGVAELIGVADLTPSDGLRSTLG